MASRVGSRTVRTGNAASRYGRWFCLWTTWGSQVRQSVGADHSIPQAALYCLPRIPTCVQSCQF